MKIGIGTYSFGGIASYLGLGPTLLEKFQKIKALGYDTVELLPADLEEATDDEIKQYLAETGLEVTSIHAKPTEEVVKRMANLGAKAVIWASSPFNCKAEALELAEELEGMAKMAEPYGIKIGYHNHNQEFFFDEGKTLLEHVLDNTTNVYFQLDCGWAQLGGQYPPNFIRKYKNRFIAIHVKENDKVLGPGANLRSRHDTTPRKSPFGSMNVKEMPLEERKALLEKMSANNDPVRAARFAPQCKMGDPKSNIDWKEIKKALDEQDFEAFWVVEREGFYDEHDKCLADDCAWLKENIQ